MFGTWDSMTGIRCCGQKGEVEALIQVPVRETKQRKQEGLLMGKVHGEVEGSLKGCRCCGFDCDLVFEGQR